MTVAIALFIIAVIEWTWTAMAVFGTVVCVWSLTDSYKDRSELRTRKLNGDALIMVKMGLRIARAGVILHVFFLILGILALQSPDEPSTVWFVMFLGTGYIAVAATNVRAVMLNQLDRVGIRRRAK